MSLLIQKDRPKLVNYITVIWIHIMYTIYIHIIYNTIDKTIECIKKFHNAKVNLIDLE